MGKVRFIHIDVPHAICEMLLSREDVDVLLSMITHSLEMYADALFIYVRAVSTRLPSCTFTLSPPSPSSQIFPFVVGLWHERVAAPATTGVGVVLDSELL